MHVINIGLDAKTLNPESVVAFRNRRYGTLLDHYSIVVPSRSDMVVNLSNKVTVYGIGARYKWIQFFRMYKMVNKLIEQEKVDVITAQDMYYLGLMGLYFARKYHIGLEVQVLGIEKLNWLRKQVAIFVMGRASVVRALSERIKERLTTEFGISEKVIRIVSIYVDVKKLGLDVRTLEGEDKRDFDIKVSKFRELYGTSFNFLTVSRLVPIKQISMQLLSLSRITKDFPQVMLHIVGEGPDKERLISEARSLGVDKHVVFYGYQTGYHLGLLYLECDVFVLTSDSEGWGMVIIEAASAGLPIIMTDVGCAGELIINEESGLIIPTRDIEALTVAMTRVISDSNLKNKLSVSATKALETLPPFSLLLELYKENWEIAFKNPL